MRERESGMGWGWGWGWGWWCEWCATEKKKKREHLKERKVHGGEGRRGAAEVQGGVFSQS